MFDFLTKYELPRDVGSKFQYSNLGTMLLGEALSRSAGLPYEALVRERILDPLGMSMTGVDLGAEMSEWTTAGHDRRLKMAPHWNMSELPALGGLHSNVPDLLRFLRANLHDGTIPLEHARHLEQAMRLRTSPGLLQVGVAVTMWDSTG